MTLICAKHNFSAPTFTAELPACQMCEVEAVRGRPIKSTRVTHRPGEGTSPIPRESYPVLVIPDDCPMWFDQQALGVVKAEPGTWQDGAVLGAVYLTLDPDVLVRLAPHPLGGRRSAHHPWKLGCRTCQREAKELAERATAALAEAVRAHTRAIWALKGEVEYPADDRLATGAYLADELLACRALSPPPKERGS